MDFFNNHEGRRIGDDFYLFSSNSEISNAVLSQLNLGILRYIKNGLLTPTNL